MIFLSNVLKNENIFLDLPEMIYAESLVAASAAVLSPAWGEASGSKGTVAAEVFNEATAMRRSTDIEAKSIFEQASAGGWAKGLDEGFQLGMDESFSRTGVRLKQIDTDLEKECGRIRAENKETCMQLGNGIIPLGLRLAVVIIYSELKDDENAFINLFKNAASHILETDSAVLNVGPRGYDIATRHAKEFEASIKGVKKFAIKLSGSNNGLCVIETPFGSIDASADTQLEKAARTLS
jgi:flagellar assembly protein FliH